MLETRLVWSLEAAPRDIFLRAHSGVFPLLSSIPSAGLTQRVCGSQAFSRADIKVPWLSGEEESWSPRSTVTLSSDEKMLMGPGCLDSQLSLEDFLSQEVGAEVPPSAYPQCVRNKTMATCPSLLSSCRLQAAALALDTSTRIQGHQGPIRPTTPSRRLF